MNDRTKAAVIGGAVAGVLSIIPIVNYCCILAAIGGGVLAVIPATVLVVAAIVAWGRRDSTRRLVARFRH